MSHPHPFPEKQLPDDEGLSPEEATPHIDSLKDNVANGVTIEATTLQARLQAFLLQPKGAHDLELGLNVLGIKVPSLEGIPAFMRTKMPKSFPETIKNIHELRRQIAKRIGYNLPE